MSWDLVMGRFPDELAHPEEIPSAFRLPIIGTNDEIIAKILEVAPEADFSDPTWGSIEGEGFSIEINLGEPGPTDQFMLHVRGGDEAVGMIALLLEHLKLRAIVIDSPPKFFEPNVAGESLQKWRAFRDSRMKDT